MGIGDVHRDQLGRIQLRRDSSLSSAVLGLCDPSAPTPSIQLSPGEHTDRAQIAYTLCHEGCHREIFGATTFGYLQHLIAKAVRLASDGKPLPPQLYGAEQLLRLMLDVSFDAHEGYATAGESVAQDQLKELFGAAAAVPPPLQVDYVRASLPYTRVLRSMPPVIQPFARFILRAFAECVFNTEVVSLARAHNLGAAAITEGLSDPMASPSHRLGILAPAMAGALADPSTMNRWHYFERLHQACGTATPRVIAGLRFLSPGADAVLLRRQLLIHARTVTRALLAERCPSVALADGNRDILDFHTWVYEAFGEFRLLDGPMVEVDNTLEKAELVVQDVRMSGLPAGAPPALEEAAPSALVVTSREHSDADRFAVSLHLPEGFRSRSDDLCQVRIVPFEARRAVWGGAEGRAFQRIMAKAPYLDHRLNAPDACQLLSTYADRTDILFMRFPLREHEVAGAADAIVGTTQATIVHLVDATFEARDDKTRLEAINRMRSGGARAFVPYHDDDWYSVFLEVAPSTFMGAITLASFRQIATSGFAGWNEWESRVLHHQDDLLREDRYKFWVGSLSTFVKLYIFGAFKGDPL